MTGTDVAIYIVDEIVDKIVLFAYKSKTSQFLQIFILNLEIAK